MKQPSGQELQRPSAFWEPHASARALPVEKGQLGLPPEFQAADTSSIFVPCPYRGCRVSASGAGFPVVESMLLEAQNIEMNLKASPAVGQ